MEEGREEPPIDDGMKVESGKWKVCLPATNVGDHVHFDAQRGEGIGELASVIAHPALHGGEFASDEAKLHLQKSCERARVADKVRRLYRTVREIISCVLAVCRHLKALMPE